MLKENLFGLMLFFSSFIHVSAYAALYIATNTDLDSINIHEDIDLNFEDIPSTLNNNASKPTPVKVKDWIETEKGIKEDSIEENIDLNALSGNGIDKDGYQIPQNAQRAPTPIIDFDLKQFFPTAAMTANITNKTVILSVQIDETGTLKSAKIVSSKIGYGFEEAAIKIIHKAKFLPGYAKGKPVKMTHRIPIHFTLDESE